MDGLVRISADLQLSGEESPTCVCLTSLALALLRGHGPRRRECIAKHRGVSRHWTAPPSMAGAAQPWPRNCSLRRAMALHFLKGRIGTALLAIAVAALGGCRRGATGSGTEQQVAAATVSTGASSTTQDQTLAAAFARQAAMYAQVAATDRAEASAVSTAIATEQQLTAAKGAADPRAALATPAMATAGTTVVNATAAITSVPATATKLENHYQKAAALADRLGATAQALASFHLARAGVAVEGGAQ